MTEQQLSPEKIRYLAGLARRLRDDPHYMANILAVYQQQERLDENELIGQLNTGLGNLVRLSLCKRPDANSPHFAEQIRQIAVYTGIEPSKLANIVRQVDALNILSKQVSMSTSKDVYPRQGQLRLDLLAAARDRIGDTDEAISLDDEPPVED